ncbi:MAG: dihydropteroate synthase, partial [Myxococcota bacterium]
AMAGVVARFGAELIVGHSRGTPETMQDAPHYDDVIEEVGSELCASVSIALDAGVDPQRICVDPGLGFGKRPEDNHALLARLGELSERVGGYGLVVGPSRKAFLGRLTGDAPAERDSATVAACAIAIFQGALAVRAHDVRGALRACQVGLALRDARREATP